MHTGGVLSEAILFNVSELKTNTGLITFQFL